MPETAVLVIAHGSPDPDWNSAVEQMIRQVKLHLPVHIAFLGSTMNRRIPDVVNQLARSGIRTVVCVPLFVTAGSTHVSEIQYMLGLRGSVPFETEVRPIAVRTRMIWCPPLEDHALVEEILVERVQELSRNPSAEELLLVGHGCELPGFRERWESLLEQLAGRLQRTFGFPAAAWATLRPDTVRQRASALGRGRRLLVLPLFVSQGYFTRRAIPERLGDAACHYTGKTYLPHPLVAGWIEQTVQETLHAQPLASTMEV